jgi:hypothetical protein
LQLSTYISRRATMREPRSQVFPLLVLVLPIQAGYVVCREFDGRHISNRFNFRTKLPSVWKLVRKVLVNQLKPGTDNPLKDCLVSESLVLHGVRHVCLPFGLRLHRSRSGELGQ